MFESLRRRSADFFRLMGSEKPFDIEQVSVPVKIDPHLWREINRQLDLLNGQTAYLGDLDSDRTPLVKALELLREVDDRLTIRPLGIDNYRIVGIGSYGIILPKQTEEEAKNGVEIRLTRTFRRH